MIRPLAGRVPDAELLARFARHKDEAAFELLVWRYHRLVAGVCRRTVNDWHAAEDAAQAAFLLLARRADRLRDGAALPGWLARVAYRCAVRARRRASGRCKPPVPATGNDEVRPGRLEREAYTSRSPGPDDLELFAALDAELDRLPDRLRLPVVLCHLDGRTYADAAAALGIPVGTLSGRLTRARAVLKDRLTRRGFAPLLVPVAVAADAGRAAAVARAAVAFAAGHPPDSSPARIAAEVLHAMSLSKLLAATAAGVVTLAVATLGVAAARPADPPPPPAPPAARPVTDQERLQGEWLFESATAEQGGDALPGYWDSRLTFRKDTVSISKSPYSEAPVETTFTLDPAARPKRMDWVVPKFYQSLLKLPAGTVQGIYEWDGDALRVCMANRPGAGPRTAGPGDGEKPVAEVVPFGPRPTEFKADAAKGHFLFTVRRWTGKPGEPLAEGRVTVLDPDGEPAEGAEVFPFRFRPEFGDWKQRHTTVTGPDGVARLPKEAVGGRLTARQPDRRLIGFARPTPAGLHHGTVSLRLVPEVRVTGRLTCPELAAAGTPIGWTNVYLRPPGQGSAWAGDAAIDTGRFEFVAPPGEHELYLYGERVDRKTVPLTVPVDKPGVDVGAIELPATRWGKLVGRPAPELADVDGWRGEPVTLAGLRDKVVLLHLWEHTQAYTAEPLPELAKLANELGGKGLRVVGVHVGRGGDVVTADQFDAAVAKLRKDQWGGRDLPFPVALTVGDKGFDDPANGFVSGSISRAAHDYALSPMTYGGTVLIDRKGVVRGLFHPKVERDRAVLDKLLAE